MARKIIAGNWKMNLNLAQGATLVKASDDYLNANQSLDDLIPNIVTARYQTSNKYVG